MKRNLIQYFGAFLILLVAVGCRQSKYVGEGNYLLKENTLLIASETGDSLNLDWDDNHDLITPGDLTELIRPTPNSSYKLFIFNRIDTVRYQKQLERKKNKVIRKNEKKQAKEDKKNKKRIDEAREKGKSEYKKKTKNMKSMSYGWRHWMVTHWGETPVVLDTLKITKSKQQMAIFLNQRGFKNVQVSDTIVYNERKKKATVNYYVQPNEPYRITSIKYDSTSVYPWVGQLYQRMLKEEGEVLIEGMLLDEGILDDERDRFTTYLKDNSYFGFTKNYISYIVDTTKGNFESDLVIFIHHKYLDSSILAHKTYRVDDITFRLNNPDSASFKDYEAYKQKCDNLGLEYKTKKGDYHLLDTMLVIDTLIRKRFITFNPEDRKNNGVKMFEKYIDTSIYYKGWVIYNETPFVEPDLLDKQNFLERGRFAKDYYKERSTRSMIRLDVFSEVSPKIILDTDNPRGSKVDIVYDLTPGKKQQFQLEPRATNTQSILGVSGLISYTNKNLSGSANKLKITLSGGFQSQPLVAGDGADASKSFKIRGLNTFEWGPEVTYSIPRFFPLSKKKQEEISKRSFPSTQIGALYNHQLRSEFDRHVGELNYKWKLSSPNQTQIFTITPVRFNYVFIKKDSLFEANLNATNDPFLVNSYSNFLSLGILNISHHYNSLKLKKRKRKSKHTFDNVVTFTAAGLVLNTIDAAFNDSLGYFDAFIADTKKVFRVPYAQYAKLENTFIFNQYIGPKHRMVYRFLVGTGYAYANGLSLPYTQSFVAGGSNDMRAWDARSMAPGSIKTYADSNSTTTQIGDMKLELNLEWRFKISKILNGAVFVDMGNIWKVKGDPLLDDGVFTFGGFYKQVAIGTGFGLRADFDFLIARLDFSWKIHNPYLPAGNRWWLAADHTEYKTYFDEDTQGNPVDYILPHGWRFNFGIGYPF
ncbi:MAG: outer membrane protein insertion porin family [Arenicella sp.]